MLALSPSLPLAVVAFAFAIGFDGEIYLQNIRGAFRKLFKHQHLEQQLAKEFLRKHFPADTTDLNCPQFFRDYEIQLKIFEEFGHKHLDKASRVKKKKVEKTLRDMEKWFTAQLFRNKTIEKNELSEYEQDMFRWLCIFRDEWNELDVTRLKRRRWLIAGMGLSILSALFMGLGSTYLLVNAFSAIPIIAAIPFTIWPLFIVPMAGIAGAAYGFLVYNAIHDMVNNNTLISWPKKIYKDFEEGKWIHGLFLGLLSVALVGLAISLTLCTAGTWWTIAKNARPLFTWIGNLPLVIMGLINPIITSISSILFNIQNTIETLALIRKEMKKAGFFVIRWLQARSDDFQELMKEENGWQLANPPRAILKIIMLPLRAVLFIGHVIFVGFGSDQVPGLSEAEAAAISAAAELGEELHYFIDHNHSHADERHEHTHTHIHHHIMDKYQRSHTQQLVRDRLAKDHSHSHDLNLPAKFAKWIFSPLYLMATLWDMGTSQSNKGGAREQFSWSWKGFLRAWDKHFYDLPKEQSVVLACEKEELLRTKKMLSPSLPSSAWQREQAVYHTDRFLQEHLDAVKIGSAIAKTKSEALIRLKKELRDLPSNATKEDVEKTIQLAATNECYNQQRLFKTRKTTTTKFVESLYPRISSIYTQPQ